VVALGTHIINTRKRLSHKITNLKKRTGHPNGWSFLFDFNTKSCKLSFNTGLYLESVPKVWYTGIVPILIGGLLWHKDGH